MLFIISLQSKNKGIHGLHIVEQLPVNHTYIHTYAYIYQLLFMDTLCQHSGTFVLNFILGIKQSYQYYFNKTFPKFRTKYLEIHRQISMMAVYYGREMTLLDINSPGLTAERPAWSTFSWHRSYNS